MARRDLGAKSGGGGYGAPAPIGYGAVPPAPTYGAPPAPSYGAGPVSSYAAYGHAPVHYEHHKEKVRLVISKYFIRKFKFRALFAIHFVPWSRRPKMANH